MLTRAWNYISAIGIKDEYDGVLVKRIKLTNQFGIISILIFLFSGINNFLLGDTFSALLIESLVVITLFGFYLNYLSYHRFTISFLFTTISLAVFYFDSYSGLLSGTYLYHFPLILAIAFVFDMKEDKAAMIFHFTLILILLLLNVVTRYSLFQNSFIDDEKRYQMFMFNLLFSSAAVGFFVYLMAQNNLKESHLFMQRIKERQYAETIAKNALEEKNVLIAELHHRVKNNLAIISGLFSLKLNDNIHEDAKNVLIESRNRVRSMALIHNKLYKKESLSEVNFEDYVKELVSEINISYPSLSNAVVIDTKVNNVMVSVNVAIPCGLILNELLTNCFKHAFAEIKKGKIDISFEKQKDYYILTVSDNGCGLPENYNQKQSLGVTVIEALCEQLEGRFSYKNQNGTFFELNFKVQ